MTLTLQEKFDKAVKYVQNLPENGPLKPDQDTKLKYYAYYKQATIGDVNTDRPGLMDFVGKAKWDAWNKVKGTSKENAQKEYVALLVEHLDKVTDKSEEVKQLIQELKE